jgi:hypothetical protein
VIPGQPPNPIIPAGKLTGYPLIARLSDDKSRYLAHPGFTLANPDNPRDAILHLPAEFEGWKLEETSRAASSESAAT